MVNISRTLKKSTFLVRLSIFMPVHKALGGPIFVFCSKDLCMMAQKISKNGGNMKIFLESCKETSKLSRNIFWGRWDHIVAQKSIFKIFFFEKGINPCNPPLVTYMRDISFSLILICKSFIHGRYSILQPKIRVRHITLCETKNY